MTRQVLPNPRSIRFAAVMGVLCCVRVAGAQGALPSPNLVLLDPAHGGADPGAHLTATLVEKDVTLAFAARLRTTLAAKGFSVYATRDGDTGMTSVQRAETANHAHAVACLLLHATASGSGVYLAASSLAPEMEARTPLPWETAQVSFLPQSLSLLDAMVRSVAATGAKPIVLRASVPPIDSLTCAAVLVELAPLSGKPANDEGYQQRVADGLTDALVEWRTQQTPVKTPPATGAEGAASPVPVKPRPRPAAPAPSPVPSGAGITPAAPAGASPFGTGAPR